MRGAGGKRRQGKQWLWLAHDVQLNYPDDDADDDDDDDDNDDDDDDGRQLSKQQ